MKITIRNQTIWPTRMLRPFIVRVARHEFDGSTPARQPRKLTVEITYTRSHSGCSGSAYHRSGFSTVSVPHPYAKRWWDERPRAKTNPVPFPVHDFVHVLAHEFGHNIGLRHAQMFGHYKDRSRATVERVFPWVTTLAVPVVREKPKPTLDEKRDAKLKAAQAALARWTTKHKLATTKLRYWSRRVKTLERRLALVAESRAACRQADLTPADVQEAQALARDRAERFSWP